MAPSLAFYQRAGLGSRTQPASEAFLAWLRAKGAPEAVLAAFRVGTLRADVEDYPLRLLSEAAMMDVNHHPIRIAVENGLLVFGESVGCGDPAAIDLRDPDGAVGYLCHETMQSVKDVRGEAFWPVAPSLGAAAELIASSGFPDDYHSAFWGSY
jgi:hypothetical protein